MCTLPTPKHTHTHLKLQTTKLLPAFRSDSAVRESRRRPNSGTFQSLTNVYSTMSPIRSKELLKCMRRTSPVSRERLKRLQALTQLNRRRHRSRVLHVDARLGNTLPRASHSDRADRPGTLRHRSTLRDVLDDLHAVRDVRRRRNSLRGGVRDVRDARRRTRGSGRSGRPR